MLQTISKSLLLGQHKGQIVQLPPNFSGFIRTCLRVRVVLHVEQNHEPFGCALKPKQSEGNLLMRQFLLKHLSFARLYGSKQRQ